MLNDTEEVTPAGTGVIGFCGGYEFIRNHCDLDVIIWTVPQDTENYDAIAY